MKTQYKKRIKRHGRLIFMMVLLIAGISTISFYVGIPGMHGPGSNLVGRQADGSVQTPINQLITPAGKQIEFGGNPISVAVSPNGKTAATIVGRSDYGGKGINVIDLENGKMLTKDFSIGLSHMWGLVYSKDGKQLYATGSSGSTGRVVVMSIKPFFFLESITLHQS